MRMRRVALAAAVVVAAGATAACAPLPFACTTIGYSSTLTVTLADPRDDVALELCLAEGCTPRPVDEIASDEPIEICQTEACITATPDGSAQGDDGHWALEGGDGLDGWTITIISGDVVGYRLLAADGTVLAEGEVEPDWVRVGGSEQCGGPAEAEVVLG